MEAIAPHRRLAGRYVLHQPIANGGMASVWEALDEVLARSVAVKILRSDLAEDSALSRRFQTEAVAAARLTNPNIVSIFDTGVDDDVHFIVMEHFRGSTLREVMDLRGPMEPDDAIRLVLPVLSALGFAHSIGVLHRDIKPGNILVGQDGRVKVADFGIAQAAFRTEDLTETGRVLGTVRYLSPEQVQGTEVDPRSDLYSVGVVLYEMLTGRAPFQAEADVATAMERVTKDPVPPRAIRPAISRPLEATVLRSMARLPDRRFHSADAMRSSLERQLARDESAPAEGIPRVRPGVPDPPGTFRSWMLVPIIAALVAIATIMAGLAIGRLHAGRARPPSLAGTGQGSSHPSEPISIREAKDYDPQGDGSENPHDAPLAIDESSETSWTTEHYTSAMFGNLKDGLGLWLDLGGDVRVDRVMISSPILGWSFELRPGPYGSPGSPLHAGDGSTTFTMGTSGKATIDLRPSRLSGLLIWIVELGPDQGTYVASIAGVTVTGPR